MLKRNGEICVDQQRERNGEGFSVSFESEARDVLENVDDLEVRDEFRL